VIGGGSRKREGVTCDFVGSGSPPVRRRRDNERASATLECHSGRINRYVG